MKLDADRLNALEAAAIAAASGDTVRIWSAALDSGPARILVDLAGFTDADWTELRRLADEINAEQETK